MKPLGIKVKVALAASITSAAMVALVMVVQMRHMKEDFTRVLFAQQTALINRTAEELDDKLNMLLGIIALSARNQPPAIAGDVTALRAYYADRAVLSLFDDVLVLDPRGEVIADLPVVANRVGVNAADRVYFQRVMATRQPLIAEPVIGRTGKQPIVQMAAPVLDEKGEVRAVLIGVLRLYKDNVLGHLRTAKVGRTGYYFALTRSETPLYVLHPELERLLKPRQPNANPATTRALNEGFEGTVRSVNSAGERALNSYKALKSVDWVLAASLPEREAFAPFEDMLFRLAVWSALASLATAALIGWLTMKLLSPLERLRRAIQGMRADAGAFAPIPVAKQDEVGELTVAFNELMGQRHAADARLGDLIELAPIAIVVVDGEGRIETFNREAERRFGHGRDEVLGRAVEILVPAELRATHQQLRQGFSSTRLTPEPVRMGEGRDLYGLRKDGGVFPVEINLSAIRGGDGVKVLAMIADITERHRLRGEVEARAAELEQARDRAEAANRAKSDFVANMSHEIRTPMNAVLGMAYLLGNTPLTAQQRKFLTMVQASGQTLLAILNDVLDFSKIEARRMELAPVDFDLDETMGTLATTMSMNAGEKELELAIAVQPDVPRLLHGDALRLQQILVNLASNAIKFTEHGEVVVRVGVERRDEASSEAVLRFEVSDTGIGIGQAQQAQLFNAFSQGDESITRRFGGTGLGLAITKRLIELLGGEIAVRSVAGEGTRFWFSLPFRVLPAAGPARRPAPGPLRALVVDDSGTSRELLGKLIRAWGWEVDEAASAEEGLERYRARLAAQRPHDVVLADWHLDGLGARALAREVRASAGAHAQPVVMMVNAFARGRLEQISGAPEADVVLVKPITASSLFDALHQALAAKSAGEDGAAAPRGVAGRLRGAHFLLVEDNLLNQAVARGILEHAGATLDVVGDGQQAVDALRADARRYDIVLMDMQMPVLDGFSATATLRRELKLTLPVIAMTAGVLASERDRCVEAGISDFIAKPVVVEEMLAVIERHLPAHGKAGAAGAVPEAAPVSPPAPATVAPVGAEPVFSMDSLMRVMGKDPKGRAVMFKMVRGALAGGMQPANEVDQAVREGRLVDAAKILHGLRGAIGVLGAKRLIRATLSAEEAIAAQRDAELPALVAEVRAVLELTLREATDWLEREDDEARQT
ncbi:response regulator [Pseudoduganella namucuonensis]|uniref:Virulence sensor protein BvgS n=1 Tax=Pseudoduganella namucuonensis TaxID=1035707 RepID=A0A1I7G604_9BURK|nr:response regulator [Pseudoduganella namucuonensis]SFU43905.1 PAS domain S-box-containing protein [Pseudoduganella namucuonensis]